MKPQSSDEAKGTTAVEQVELPEGGKNPTKVRYVGTATHRRISTEQWAAAGVPDQEPLFMNRGEALDLEGMNPKAIEVMMRDGNFKFE